jgi:hypothetical protein
MPPAVQRELVEARALLTAELKASRKVIDVFLLTTAELEANINSYIVLNKKFNIFDKAHEFFLETSIAATNYHAHFLNNFERLLWKMKEYIESLPEIQQRAHAKLYVEIERQERKIEEYKDRIDAFTGDCIKALKVRKNETLTREELQARLEQAKKDLLPFARTASTEVFKHLAAIEEFIVKARILAPR